MMIRAIVAVTVILVSQAITHAEVIVYGNPGEVQPHENLLFNSPGLISTGNPVTGATNQSGFVLDLSSSAPPTGVVLTTPSGGQARVQNVAYSNSNQVGISSLTITPNALANPQLGFSEVEFNVNLLRGQTGFLQLDFAGIGTVTPATTTVDLNGDPLALGNGSNWIGIETINDTLLQSVTLTALDANGNPVAIIQDVRQIRVTGGDVNDPQGGPITIPSTPEPFSLAIWAILAIVAVAFYRRIVDSQPRGV